MGDDGAADDGFVVGVFFVVEAGGGAEGGAVGVQGAAVDGHAGDKERSGEFFFSFFSGHGKGVEGNWEGGLRLIEVFEPCGDWSCVVEGRLTEVYAGECQ